MLDDLWGGEEPRAALRRRMDRWLATSLDPVEAEQALRDRWGMDEDDEAERAQSDAVFGAGAQRITAGPPGAPVPA